MKILVLGNGFDLDHELPTGYSHFLNFCNYIVTMDNPELDCYEKLTKTQRQYVEILKNNKEVKQTFCTFIKDNCFLYYFNTQREFKRENWIDFEHEIKYIISEFKNIEYELEKTNKTFYLLDKEHKLHKILASLNIDDKDDYLWDKDRLESIHKILLYSFNNLALALEYYIVVFINNTPVFGVSPDIVDFGAKNILTFNYSNTYEKVYGGLKWNEQISYIHGVASSEYWPEASIILGITSRENELQNYFVEFEKYFQRITKQTGNEYRNWLQVRSKEKDKTEIMFFGHSLDASDEDVIKDLINHDNSIALIYYYDEKAFQQIVANLIKIFGKTKIIDYVSGREPKIKFIKQRKHLNDNTGGIQITRDTQKVYKFHSMSAEEIEKCLLEIKSEIENENLQYFHSQKDTISLFDALRYHDLELADKLMFLKICRSLDYEVDSKGNIVWLNCEEWNNYTPWGDEEPCDIVTSELVSKVNQLNARRFLEKENKKLYASILTMKTSEEIKEALISIFEVDTPDKSYWKQLDELSELMYENTPFSEALKLLHAENLPIAIGAKVKHFQAVHDENCYRIGYMKQMEDEYCYNEEA